MKCLVPGIRKGMDAPVLSFSRAAALLLLTGALMAPGAQAEQGCPAGFKPGDNLVINGDFADGLAPWSSDSPTGAPNQVPGDNGVAVINGPITDGGQINQQAFGGDPANAAPASTTWLYSNGNHTDAPVTFLRQTVSGLTAGETYVLSGYYSSTIINPGYEVDPNLEVRVDGAAIFGPTIALEDDPDAWNRFEGTFTASGATADIKLIDNAIGTIGDDLGVTAISLRRCAPIAAAAIDVTPTSLVFQDTTEGEESGVLAVTVTNPGTAPLTLSGISAGGADAAEFLVDAPDCGDTLAAGEQCQVFAKFMPQSTGVKNATITIASSEGDVEVSMTGTAVATPVGTLAIAPATHTFPRTAPGATSEARAVTVTNNGPGPLKLTDIATDPADFVVSGGDCSVGDVLAADASCTVEVSFSPTTEGNHTGSLTVATDNGSGSVTLFGFGGANPVGILIADPNSALFDETVVGATGNSLDFTFTNNGSAPITLGGASIDPGFNITANNCESGKLLAPGESCLITVQFQPVVTGLNATNLTLESSAGPASAGMAGQGQPSPTPVLNVAPDTVVLPTTPVGNASDLLDATLSNIGESPLTVGEIALAGAAASEFTVDDGDCAGKILASGETCTLKIGFAPAAEGLRNASATIASDGGDKAIELVGFATPALAGKLETSPLTRAFANTAIGQEDGPQPVVVTNVGSLVTTVTETRIEGDHADDFRISSDTCRNKDLAPGEECRIKISFKPSDIGARSATLVVSSAEGEARTELSGFGAAGPVSDISIDNGLLAKGLDLGVTLIGETGDQQTISIENRGTAPLQISELSVVDPDQFIVDGAACTGGLIPARGKCDVKVKFRPAATGPQATALTIRSDDPTRPILTVGLRGVGSSGDRDHDGLPDNIEEAGPTDPDNPDTDSDGLLDGVEDANHNGVFDEGETNPVDDDTDNDFILDGKEDRNHDGIRQDDETDPRIADTDGDGIIDGKEDANHDGLFSFGETDPLKVDTDKDGIPDGIEDANHNGLLETGETNPRIPETAVAGVEGGQVVETGIDGGAGAFGLPLLTLLGGLAAFRRRRLLALVALPLLLLAASAWAAEDNLYVGIGGGLSNLQPDRNGTVWFVTDDQDVGYKAFLGYDFRDFLSIEGYYSDLGAAELTAAPSVGHIDYKAFGLNGLWYIPNNLPGLQAFLKLGIGKIDTKSDKVPFKQVENTQLTAGGGVEWLFRSGLGLRLDYDYFDTDAQLVSLNLLKRFGRPHKTTPAPVIADLDEDGVPDKDDECPNTPLGVSVDAVGCPPKPKDSDGDGVTDDKDQCPNTAAGVAVDEHGCPRDSDGDGVIDASDKCPATPAGVKVGANGCPVDSDGDGVIDASDKCPDTPAGVSVDSNGCKPVVVTAPPPVERFNGVLEGVNFFTGSARLTPLAKIKLDGIAKQLLEYPDANILVVGHTDSRGSAASNKKLSIERAHAVANYLVRKGLEPSHIRYTGKGESQPIASNATEKGRALNRRVELIVR